MATDRDGRPRTRAGVAGGTRTGLAQETASLNATVEGLPDRACAVPLFRTFAHPRPHYPQVSCPETSLHLPDVRRRWQTGR